MDYFSALHFIAKYGIDKMQLLIKLVNDPTKNLCQIALMIGMSVPQLHRYRKKLFTRVYAPTEDLIRALDTEIYKEKKRIEQNESIINDAKIIHLDISRDSGKAAG